MKARVTAAMALPFVLFAVAFFASPFGTLGHLTLMPGNVGDARLNNYFLENIYLFFSAGSTSLWNPPFFYPFPYVLGFSDNLFGAAPVYAIARWISGEPDTAFQVWFLFAYLANFVSARYALKRLAISDLGASLGALIFTFALPVTAHAGHAQLHYRFGLPLALAFFANFLVEKRWRLLLAACAWTTWQFYCGIYIGFFTVLLLAAQSVVYLLIQLTSAKGVSAATWSSFRQSWTAQGGWNRVAFFLGMLVLAGLLLVLFYPYLRVSRMYEAKRTWDEISTMLPRPQSYFLADASRLWASPNSTVFSGIPMRHEHQMFVGMVPLLLALCGLVVGLRSTERQRVLLLGGSLLVAIAATLYIGGYSLWYLFHKLPLASAIRAMSRFDLAILFPVAYLAALAIDWLRARIGGKSLILFVLFPLVVFEFSSTNIDVSSKTVWRQRLSQADARIQQLLSKDAILFMSQRSDSFSSDELDAMWVALRRGVKTLNGYSGGLPPGFAVEYGDDCAEAPRRVIAYMTFKHAATDVSLYKALMSRVVPVGFAGCDTKWFSGPPPLTAATRVYTKEELRQLHYEITGRNRDDNGTYVDVRIDNNGDNVFSARSAVGRPLRFSWRFLDTNGNPASNFEKRRDLQFDVPAHGEARVRIPIESAMQIEGGTLEVSLVQEGEFWAHDIGVPTARYVWK